MELGMSAQEPMGLIQSDRTFLGFQIRSNFHQPQGFVRLFPDVPAFPQSGTEYILIHLFLDEVRDRVSLSGGISVPLAVLCDLVFAVAHSDDAMSRSHRLSCSAKTAVDGVF